jgi:DNA-binding GntR family transcriptional regulator
LFAILAPDVKLPGVEAATGSTILHFIHPHQIPIIDVRTIGTLFAARLISTDRKDLEHYEEFRQAIEKIRRACPAWSLREIDRALFAYHKQVLDTSESRCL